MIDELEKVSDDNKEEIGCVLERVGIEESGIECGSMGDEHSMMYKLTDTSSDSESQQEVEDLIDKEASKEEVDSVLLRYLKVIRDSFTNH